MGGQKINTWHETRSVWNIFMNRKNADDIKYTIYQVACLKGSKYKMALVVKMADEWFASNK